MSGARRARKRATQHIMTASGDDKEETSVLNQGTRFKALKSKNVTGYQALEREQEPAPRFPGTLASYVLVFPMDDEWIAWTNGEEPESVSYALLTAQPLMDKMRSSDMIVRVFTDDAQKRCYALVSISEKRQKMVAQIMSSLIRLRLKRQDDEDNYIKNGGAWSDFKQHLAALYERSSEGTLFSSCQQCQIIEFLLNDVDERALGPQLMQKDACEFGNTTLVQLKKDEKIMDFFYMHHADKRKWLENNWSRAYLAKQPLEDVREYFGETTALYFAWMGYILTMAWVPAGVGLFVFVMSIVAYVQASTGDNPYVPLLGIFMCVWSIALVSGWKTLQLTLQHEWDTKEYSPPKADRQAFVQNKWTYKRLNKLSVKEEYYPDPLFRAVALAVSTVAVPLAMAMQMMLSYGIFSAESSASESLGGKYGFGAFFFTVFEGAAVAVTTYLFDRYGARLLSDLENWQTNEEYYDARVTKYIFFSNVAMTFCVYLWGLIGNAVKDGPAGMACPHGRCYDYLNLKIPVLLLSIRIFRSLLRAPLKAFFEDSMEGIAKAFFKDMMGFIKEKVAAAGAFFSGIFSAKKSAGAEAGGGDGKEDGDGDTDEESRLRMQGKWPAFSRWDLHEWYIEKILDLLWVMLFSGVFPLLPLGLLVVQIIDLRYHAFHLTSATKRMNYSCSKSLGIYDDLMDICVAAGIMTQCCMFAFASDGLLYYLPSLSATQRAFLALVVEHLLLFLWAVWSSTIGVPDAVQLAYDRKKEEKKHLLHDMANFNPKKDVVFYTSDDGEAFYGKKKTSA